MKRLGKLRLFILFAAFALRTDAQVKPVLSILGDSYSTFEGHNPAGNATWYAPVAWEKRTDVTDVKQTWWWQLIKEGGYKLGVNESFSGSTISYTGYNQEDYRECSFLTRLPRIIPSDLLVIFGGTNDSWTGGPLGEFIYDNLTLGHMYEFRPALGRLLQKAQNHFPGTRILFVINTELKKEITTSIMKICRHYKIEYIQLQNIDKLSGHPSKKGMIQIKEQILQYLQQ